MGLTPADIYGLELWEYNACLSAYDEVRQADVRLAILTGYYAAYYMSGSRGVKSPDELMKKLFSKKQSREDGLAQIERIKRLEQKEEEEHARKSSGRD